MKVRFWGTRGSIATPGPGTTRFGGNTSCVEVVTANGGLLILVCGTGVHPLATKLMAENAKATNAKIHANIQGTFERAHSQVVAAAPHPSPD